MNYYITSVVIVCFSVVIGFVASTNATDFDSEVRQGPVPVNAGDAGIGRMIADFQFTAIDDQEHRLSDFSGSKVTVIAMTGTGCPLCLKYTPTLAAIERDYRDRGVQFLFVNPNKSEHLDRSRLP